jgi:sarcosine oxidase subunit gamma
VARLLPLPPAEGLGLPVEIGGVRLTAPDPGPLTLVAPFRGQDSAVAAALRCALGFDLPGPVETRTGAGARAIWFGWRQGLVMGAALAPGVLDGIAAVTDQSDGWAAFRLDGSGTDRVLARLTPLDLRPHAFPPGRTARTLIGHMAASVTRWAPDSCDILVFRSMAGTAVHDLTTAMARVAARTATRG